MSLYIELEGRAEGPLSLEEVQSRLGQRLIRRDTRAWRAGMPEWKTVGEVLDLPVTISAADAVAASPPPLPPQGRGGPPSHATTAFLAGMLVLVDGLLYGSGKPSEMMLLIVIPALMLRVLMTRSNRHLMRVRLDVVGIYLVASLSVLVLVKDDRRGARERAGQVIAACEAYRRAQGAYPRNLSALVPRYFQSIPPARKLGWLVDREFQYFDNGREALRSLPDSPVLVYVEEPPSRRSYYVFADNRWGTFE